MVLQKQGDLDAAEPLLREALEMRRRTLDEGHPDLASSLANLALVMAEKGNAEAADSLYLEALAVFDKTDSQDHRELRVIRNSYARFLRDQGRNDEAAIIDAQNE